MFFETSAPLVWCCCPRCLCNAVKIGRLHVVLPLRPPHHSVSCSVHTFAARAAAFSLRSKLLLSRMRARSCSSLLGLLTVLRSGFLLCPRTGTRIRSSRQRIASVLKPRVVAGCSSENRIRIWRSCRQAAVPCRRLYKPRNPGVAARFVELATIGVHTDLTCFFGAYAARRERSLAMSAHDSF